MHTVLVTSSQGASSYESCVPLTRPVYRPKNYTSTSLSVIALFKLSIAILNSSIEIVPRICGQVLVILCNGNILIVR